MTKFRSKEKDKEMLFGRKRKYFSSFKDAAEAKRPKPAAIHVCPLCKRHVKFLVQDHCHATGLCRDVICNGCNTLLGIIECNPLQYDELSLYIRTWSVRHESGGLPYRRVVEVTFP